MASGHCSVLSVPITNVSLGNGLITRGASIQLGTPPQALAFAPTWLSNNTFPYSTSSTGGLCELQIQNTTSSCKALRGGFYNAIGSSSWQSTASNIFPNDTGNTGGRPNLATDGTDTFVLNPDVTLSNFPVATPTSFSGEQNSRPMNSFGLGTNSSILSALARSKQIASRTWSMFWGLQGEAEDHQLDGIFVFGGYDRAKVNGENFTLALKPDDKCPTGMLVTIEDLVLAFPDGSTSSLVSGPYPGKSFPACIDPSAASLAEFTLDPYFLNYIINTGLDLDRYNDTSSDPAVTDWSRDYGLNYYTMIYEPGVPIYGGDLLVKIKSGPNIRVYNHQLIVPQRALDNNGEIIANTSTPNLPIVILQDNAAKTLAVLGRLFLTSAYVMVNQEANTFTLWQANPTSVEDLVGVDKHNVELTDCPSTSASIPPVPTSSSRPSAAPSTSSGLSGGEIAGIVIGSVCFLGVIGASVWYCLKRGSLMKNQRPPEGLNILPESSKMTVEGDMQQVTTSQIHEIGPSQEPAELHS